MKTDLSAESIQHMAQGFSRSRVLLTGVELDIFTLLKEHFLSAAEIVDRLNSDLRATTILLDALVAMELLAKERNRYRTNPEVALLLTADSEESILPGFMHTAHLWKTWSQLTEVVQDGGPAPRPEEAGDRTKAFIGAMHVRALRDTPELVRAINPGTARNLIDVGGGSGSYTIGFLEAVPGMKATIFDLPDVIPMARERLADKGLSDRVDLVPGDYNTDELPPGHDLAFLSAIIHQNSHDQNVALYKKILHALDPGGRIIVRDCAMNTDRTRPTSGALFAINMLVNTSGGNSYTFDEIKGGLEEAGFGKVRQIQDSEMSSLVEGIKP
ncbi:MAG: methyltransferase [bacterium]|nr:methyltransferase [bacterium]MDT8366425.1 methyltransferase [bacterium]